MGKRIVGDAELTSEEAAVWAAVYADDWANSFRSVSACHGFNHLEVDPYFNGGTPFGHAEHASAVADLAVLDLRGWKANG